MSTNFDKLVRWDADYYKDLTDDDCIICVTEREVYIIGQIIEMIKWSRTRWIGDILGLDFDLIASNLEYKLAERMTCQNVTTLLQKITELEQKIDYVFNETAINEGDTDIIYNPETTVIDDVHTPEELADFGVQADVCDTSGKDAVYGAVNQLVRYIVQRNVDFLEQVNQAGNTPDQIARVVSAVPGIGILPIDEIFDWVSFISEELEDEYNATVDEALIQQVVCDLFCIAVASGCTLDFNDVYNYFASKVSATFSNAATTFLNLVQFGINGTFTGDDYFFYMSYFQLATVGLGQFYLGTNSLNDYAYQARAGMNSPDNDWSIFCIDCPDLYRLKIWDFTASPNGAYIADGFVLADGEHTTGGWALTQAEGEDEGDGFLTLGLALNPTWRIKAIGIKVAGASAGSGSLIDMQFRTVAGVYGGGYPRSWGSTGWTYYEDTWTASGVTYISGFQEFAISYARLLSDGHKVSHIGMIFEADHAPLDAVITENTVFSGTVFP